MIPPLPELFARCGERDTKLTKYKEQTRRRGPKSLYLGLLYNIIAGLALAVLIYLVIFITSRYVVKKYYMTPERAEERHSTYIDLLQSYVIEEDMDLQNSSKIAEWVRRNPYVYLLVYESESQMDFTDSGTVVPGVKDRLSELLGTRLDESISREELIATAKSRGYRLITLTDGYVIVALAEYSENLYKDIFTGVSLLAAALTFILMLVRYIGLLIERIKRFASDVTIVSELNMDYEIVSEGADELAGLSSGVENMRRTMLRHIESEKEARAANTELITSVSHDIRTPLTVLMGYVEMMRARENDEVMQSYIDATESTAMRLKQLSDDMFKYLLAFGDTDKEVSLETYDASMLFDQILSEHILLLRENGYDIEVEGDRAIPEGSLVSTDAPNLMRIVDNIFSNINKYADMGSPIYISFMNREGRLTLEVKNKIRKNTEGAESSRIGLRTCTRLGSIVAESFKYEKNEEYFTCRLTMKITLPEE